MKNKLRTSILLFISLLMCSSLLFAQKVLKNEVSFDYRCLPLQPLNKSIKNYSSDIVMKYKGEIDSLKKAAEMDFAKAKVDLPAKIKEAELKFEADKKDYELKKKAAEDKYKLELEDYNKKSVAEKFVEKNVLEENNKPYLQMPPTPYLQTPPQPQLVYPDKVNRTKVHDKDVLINTYLMLDGFTRGSDNAVKITVIMNGFENQAPELKYTESTVIENGVSRPVRNYYYEVKYKHPMNLKIETPDKGIIYDQIVPGSNEYVVYKTATNQSQYNLGFNEQSVLINLQDKSVEENMKKINEFINSNYGFSVKKKSSTIFSIEPKNFAYDEYTLALENALGGYNHLIDDFPGATVKIQTAISSWEKAYAESDVTNKKGRINLDVTIATLFNLVEANIFINNFEAADKYLTKLYLLDLSKKERTATDDFKAFWKDQKSRFEANKF